MHDKLGRAASRIQRASQRGRNKEKRGERGERAGGAEYGGRGSVKETTQATGTVRPVAESSAVRSRAERRQRAGPARDCTRLALHLRLALPVFACSRDSPVPVRAPRHTAPSQTHGRRSQRGLPIACRRKMPWSRTHGRPADSLQRLAARRAARGVASGSVRRLLWRGGATETCSACV
jgi:hypothetical protein